jgi:Holliday junction DNA helicase RuvA
VVREDAHILYAFATEDERRLFRGLLKVSGVGPKIALGILSGLSVADFLRVLEAEDAAALVRIPGVGRKTAERILIDMRDKTGDLSGTGSAFVPMSTTAAPSAHQEASVALVALGYRPQEVARLLKAAGDDAQTTEELIRRALRAAAG